MGGRLQALLGRHGRSILCTAIVSFMAVSLQPITLTNWNDAIALYPREEQDLFVAGNLYSIAESQFGFIYESEGHWSTTSFGIYSDDLMVGFAMIAKNYSATTAQGHISRLMVDGRHQGKGYGRAAMQLLLAEFARDPMIRVVRIGYTHDNIVARKLYASLGFVEIGTPLPGHEHIALLTLR